METGADDEESYEAVKKIVLDVVAKHFSPEFVNRIDETVVFHPLGKEQIRAIAEIQLELLNQRLVNNELALKVSDAVLDHIASTGYDPVYGARPLKRAIQNLVENPLAQEVLKGSYVAGDTIFVDMDFKGEYRFSKTVKALDSAVA